ncbi:hypothetical protein TIFTF001_005379 [Ficus carica]|uniref:mannan endo-1,4-beta-mannosidase n=1 Tax=Ficus carica TaxID=3494 RepID=A0AA88A7F8_FICCA|nr:hypothetical protein TIFTF001_005379 [Ficus carica]
MGKWGVVLIGLVTGFFFHQVIAEDGFVKTRGVQLVLNGYPFYANGFNAYWLMYMASDPSQRDKTILTRTNTLTGVAYKDEPAIMAWELMNEPRCPSDPSGNTIQAWITEMASYVKSIDGNHLLEAGLEGFYGPSKPQTNSNFLVGTDFISNNQIPGIDFATVHSYPDQWLSGSSSESQLAFLRSWLNDHIQDAQNILKKPVLFAEFGKSGAQRDELFNTVYSAIYSSASAGGSAVGGLFWQLLSQGMDSFRDGYEVVLSDSTSTVALISQESQKLNHIRKMYARLKNLDKLKRAKDIRNAQSKDVNKVNETGS